MNNRVWIFDTTLRDGEQSPGATLTSGEKLEVARALSRLGVDVIEGGFPAASPDDLEAVRSIATEVGRAPRGPDGRRSPPVICGLARAVPGDIEKCWTAVQPAARPRIHTFIATSPVHRQKKLCMSPKEVLERIRAMVLFARERCADVEFSAEDAGRTEPEFLHEALERAIESGATTINVPDTVGYRQPEEFGELIAGIQQRVRGIEGVRLSVHCHNDLGLATANTLAGIQAGARQIEVTINGIGERAGNTALEECVLALKTRREIYGVETGIDASQIASTSRLVSRLTGMVVQANKAIVGANAFAHEAGIHQDGMLKDEETYEIIRPETVGVEQSRLVLGKHSGRRAFGARLEDLGHPLEGEALDRVFARFKALADRKKAVTDSDLLALATDEVGQPEVTYSLEEVNVSCGTSTRTATVGLRGPDGKVHLEAAVGDGPVEAVFMAIDAIVKVDCRLVDYRLHATTGGKNAVGEAVVKVQSNQEDLESVSPQHGSPRPRLFHGHGASIDILEASAQGYVAAINKLLAAARRRQSWPLSEGPGSGGDLFMHQGVDTGAPPESPALWGEVSDAKGGRRAG